MNYKDLIYKNYYSKRIGRSAPKDLKGLASRQPFYKNIINSHFPKNKTIEILELGCGYGAFLHHIQNAGYVNCTGIDASAEMVEIANKLNINGIATGDVVAEIKSRKDKSLDLIIAIDLIEHFTKSDLFELVIEFERVLKPGGRVITHQPNAEGVFGNAILYGDYTHEQAFTRVSVAQLFLSCGFSKVSSYEDVPIAFNLKSFVRKILWLRLVRPLYLFLIMVESGGSDKDIALTKNFLSVAIK